MSYCSTQAGTHAPYDSSSTRVILPDCVTIMPRLSGQLARMQRSSSAEMDWTHHRESWVKSPRDWGSFVSLASCPPDQSQPSSCSILGGRAYNDCRSSQ